MKKLKPFEIDLSGTNLVEASAGTGKTYNITSLYIRTLIERDISVGKILVVTYTEAATKELKERLLKRIRQSISVLKKGESEDKDDQFLRDLLSHVENTEEAVKKLKAAVRSFDEASVYTIHGFCYQALQEQAFDSGAMYDAEMIGDDSELLQEAVDDYWRSWMAEASGNEAMHPLLKLIMGGYNPEKLARELQGQLAKLYLKVKPEESNGIKFRQLAARFGTLYAELRQEWNRCRQELFDLLDTGDLSYYTTNSLEKWFGLMDDFLKSDTPSTNTFTQFYRFQQSNIDESLKKGPQKKGVAPPQHSFFEKTDEYVQLLESVKDYEAFFKKDLFFYLKERLIQKKEELQVLSYDDLLLRLRNALFDGKRGEKLAEVLRKKYPITMVDEFQDTDPNQYDIFRRIYSNGGQSTLLMIGDPKQSIYSFRGADVFSYLKARTDAPPENQYKLDRNFRSAPNLLQGLNTFFGKHDDPFLLNKISYKTIEWGKKKEKYDSLIENRKQLPAIRFRRLTEAGQGQINKGVARKRVVEDTVREVARLLEGGENKSITIGKEPVKAKDIAILVRRHDQADMISEELQKKGIKSVQQSDKSVFQSREADHLQVFLKAVAEPRNETQVKTALSLPLTGYSASELLEMEEDEERWIQILNQFADWHKKWQEQGFSAMFRSVINQANISRHVIKFADGERRLTNILHLGELLHDEAQHHKKGMQGILKWLARKRRENTGNREEEQLRLESDEELVKVVTMHRSKGLEYPIVFCPFLWYGPYISDNGDPLVYHDKNNTDTTILDLRGSSDPDRNDNRRKALKEEIAESLRLAYVAMTRAKQCLYLTWDYASCSEFSALGYLLQDPQKFEKLLRAKFGDDNYKKPDGAEMHRAIEDLCSDYPDLFSMQMSPPKQIANRQLDLLDSENKQTLVHRNFQRTGPLASARKVSSFSSLTSRIDDDPDLPDYDQFLSADNFAESEKETTEQTIFNFPRGPQPGTCIHKIFEEIDFQNPGANGELITTQLSRYGIDECWNPVVIDMLTTVTRANIHPQNKELSLSGIKPQDFVQELEFYYQTGDIATPGLLSIIRSDYDIGAGEEQSVSGFLKGYIDLTFQFNGKFYLLDYKTNHLGNSVDDYAEQRLRQEMEEAAYDLQYHIYTIALHRFLKKHMKENYDYDKHFGGAFYLFLRGMNEYGREGIFFDRPDFSTILELDEYLLSGGKAWLS